MTSKPRLRALLPNLALFLFSLLLVAVLGEAYLRLRLPFEEQRYRYMRSRNVFQYVPSNLQFDPEVGFLCRPNLSVRFSNIEYRTRVVTNSESWRDDEASLRDPGILLLGDSFFFGWGINKEEDVDTRLESLTGVRALNMAVPGYATQQEFILLRRWAEKHPLRDRIVLVQFYGNDIPGMDHKPGDVFPAVLPGPGGVAFTPVPRAGYEAMFTNARSAMNRGVARWSFLADFVQQRWPRFKDKLAKLVAPRAQEKSSATAPATPESPPPAAPAADSSAVRPIMLVTRAMKEMADREGFHLLFVYVPSVRYYEGRPTYDKNALEALMPALEAARIPWVDLRPVLSRQDYFRLDDHWRPSGDEKAARVIVERMQAEGWLGNVPPECALKAAPAP